PAARIADQTAHGGVITVGLPTVEIGQSTVVSTPQMTAHMTMLSNARQETAAATETTQETSSDAPRAALRSAARAGIAVLDISAGPDSLNSAAATSTEDEAPPSIPAAT